MVFGVIPRVMAKAKVYALTIANGALLEVPAFEESPRGKNWLAIIDVDATSPGGLSRKFLDRGRGECFYIVEQLGLFDAVEFGADYTTGTGRKHPKRWYGVVVAKTEGVIHVEEAASGAKAVLRSKAARESTADRARALRVERDELIKRAAELEQALREIMPEGEPPPEAGPQEVAKA